MTVPFAESRICRCQQDLHPDSKFSLYGYPAPPLQFLFFARWGPVWLFVTPLMICTPERCNVSPARHFADLNGVGHGER